MAAGKSVSFGATESYAKEFPKVWGYRPSDRNQLSHWSRHHELPLLRLLGNLDTDHWAKLKRTHKHYALTSELPPRHHSLSINELPKPHGGLHQHYYDQSRRREHLLQEGRTMYAVPPDAHAVKTTKQTTPKRTSIYNQHARNGFKFWLDGDPKIKKVSFYSKYTFGSKYTVHGLGNAPRN